MNDVVNNNDCFMELTATESVAMNTMNVAIATYLNEHTRIVHSYSIDLTAITSFL